MKATKAVKPKKQGTAHKRWYDAHGVEYNKKRHSRYHSDPVYRAKCIENARKSRSNRRSTQPPGQYRELNGIKYRVFGIGPTAEMVGVTKNVLRKWNQEGVIPPCSFGCSHRVYTQSQVDMLVAMKAEIDECGTRKRCSSAKKEEHKAYMENHWEDFLNE